MVQNTEKAELNPTQELIAALEAQGFTDLVVMPDKYGKDKITVRKPRGGGTFNVVEIIPGRREKRFLIPGGNIGQGVLYEDLQEEVVSDYISPYIVNWGDEPLAEIDTPELARKAQRGVNRAVRQGREARDRLLEDNPKAKRVYQTLEEIYDEVGGKGE